MSSPYGSGLYSAGPYVSPFPPPFFKRTQPGGGSGIGSPSKGIGGGHPGEARFAPGAPRQ